MKYKTSHSAIFPPFSVFVDFIKEMSKVKNDPSFIYNNDVSHNIEKQPTSTFRGKVSTKKTTVLQQTEAGLFTGFQT